MSRTTVGLGGDASARDAGSDCHQRLLGSEVEVLEYDRDDVGFHREHDDRGVTDVTEIGRRPVAVFRDRLEGVGVHVVGREPVATGP